MGFVENWTPPAIQGAQLRDDVRHILDVIRAIAPGVAARAVGYAVYEQIPDRERDCGFEHLAVSAVMETLAQAENALEYCREHADNPRKYFVICAVQQNPT
jgi:hypothetical protein